MHIKAGSTRSETGEEVSLLGVEELSKSTYANKIKIKPIF